MPYTWESTKKIQWADLYARVTYRFEFAMVVYCQLMTMKAIVKVLHIPKSTLSALLHRTIKRIRYGHKIKGLKSSGIDKISYCKGKKYATIVYGLEQSRVICVDQVRKEEWKMPLLTPETQ